MPFTDGEGGANVKRQEGEKSTDTGQAFWEVGSQPWERKQASATDQGIHTEAPRPDWLDGTTLGWVRGRDLPYVPWHQRKPGCWEAGLPS